MSRGSWNGFGPGVKGSTGTYKWDPGKEKFVKVSSDVPKLEEDVTFTGPRYYQNLGDENHPQGRYIESRTELRRVLRERNLAQIG